MLTARYGRRASCLLLSLAALLCCLTVCFPRPVAASPARDTLEKYVTAILDCIKAPAYANAATRPAQREKIAGLVRQVFDFQEFAIRTAGPRWKTFTPDQQKRFTDAFADLLLTTYISKVDGYNGEQIAYTGEVANKEQTRVEERTIITLGDGKKVPVAYRMMLKDGAWRCYDVLIENVSLVKNYRTQFQDILSNAAPDELISRVQAKAKEAAANAR
ncbi:ABC transporter substrate-binding protein [uncultured Desulfovibrio sp.]|uniref:Tgt2/MlaC family protein n=1 Tax=uncultured Desulfovibrio sp. TaxID=167968 RepID=UPI0025D81DE2|nr:ABC transporter substrate-binding protein [uncultured Desulfovibrio sp.]